jgi:hypothetical protein
MTFFNFLQKITNNAASNTETIHPDDTNHNSNNTNHDTNQDTNHDTNHNTNNSINSNSENSENDKNIESNTFAHINNDLQNNDKTYYYMQHPFGGLTPKKLDIFGVKESLENGIFFYLICNIFYFVFIYLLFF